MALDAVAVTLAGQTSFKVAPYAGLTLSGNKAGTYRIEYLDQFVPQATINWLALTNLTVTQFPYLYIDTSVPMDGAVRRFYRIVFVP